MCICLLYPYVVFMMFVWSLLCVWQAAQVKKEKEAVKKMLKKERKALRGACKVGLNLVLSHLT